MASLAIPFFSPRSEFILITIPVNIIIAYIPWLIKVFMLCCHKTYDNANPRLYIGSLENDALAGNNAARCVLRAHACNLNGIESILCWSAAPIASLAFSDNRDMALSLCAIFLGLRVIYTFLYLVCANRCLSYLRTIVFYCAWACPLIMLFEAAHFIGDRSINEKVGTVITTA